MKLLLDTHLILWAADVTASERSKGLSARAAELIDDPMNQLWFSAASIWEISIKSGLGRSDFKADANVLRRGLLDNGYTELTIASAHAVMVAELPDHHKDPFDRILVAQAKAEGITLLTSDPLVAAYPGPIMLV